MVEIKIEVSKQTLALLTKLAHCGLYGATEEVVVARIVDRMLQAFVVPPQFEIVNGEVLTPDQRGTRR